MVTILDNKEITTCREAMIRYENHYIGFVVTEQNFTDPDNEKGYVVCIMDSYEEGFSIPRRTDDGQFITVMPGYAVGGTEIGVILYEGVSHA